MTRDYNQDNIDQLIKWIEGGQIGPSFAMNFKKGLLDSIPKYINAFIEFIKFILITVINILATIILKVIGLIQKYNKSKVDKFSKILKNHINWNKTASQWKSLEWWKIFISIIFILLSPWILLTILILYFMLSLLLIIELATLYLNKKLTGKSYNKRILYFFKKDAPFTPPELYEYRFLYNPYIKMVVSQYKQYQNTSNINKKNILKENIKQTLQKIYSMPKYTLSPDRNHKNTKTKRLIISGLEDMRKKIGISQLLDNEVQSYITQINESETLKVKAIIQKRENSIKNLMIEHIYLFSKNTKYFFLLAALLVVPITYIFSGELDEAIGMLFIFGILIFPFYILKIVIENISKRLIYFIHLREMIEQFSKGLYKDKDLKKMVNNYEFIMKNYDKINFQKYSSQEKQTVLKWINKRKTDLIVKVKENIHKHAELLAQAEQDIQELENKTKHPILLLHKKRIEQKLENFNSLENRLNTIIQINKKTLLV